MGICPSHCAQGKVSLVFMSAKLLIFILLCKFLDFLQGLDQQPPVFPAWETPAYSNAAFRILGYVAANVTNITMVDAFGAAIFRPLGLEHTYASKPPDFSGVIPATGESLWDFELGDDMP